MNRFLVYILLSFFVLSCSDIDKPKKPNNLLSKNKMIDIITDISLVNAAKGMNSKLLDDKKINPVRYVYEKHGIDSTQFAENSNYYAYDIKEYEDIYVQVKQRLEKEKQKYKELEEKEKKKKDSIKESKRQKIDSIKSNQVQKELIQDLKSKDLLKKDRMPLE